MPAVLLFREGRVTSRLMLWISLVAFAGGLCLGHLSRYGYVTAGLPQVNAKVAAVDMLRERFPALLSGDTQRIQGNYRLDTETGVGAWENEVARVRYLRSWLTERGIRLTGAGAWFEIDSFSPCSEPENDCRRARLEITEHALYQYVHEGAPVPLPHCFGSRAVHVLEIAKGDGGWQIDLDWYLDPLGTAPLDPGKGTVAPGTPESPSEVRRYEPEKAAAYAVAHSGVRSVPGGGRYNPAYRVYSYEGGDCTNFASQVLLEGGLTQEYGWFYAREGSVSWARSEDLIWFLLATGRGLRAFRGSFDAAVRPSAESPRGPVAYLRLGDIIAYENGGEVRHVAVVVGFDPWGWPVIACHTADRLFFPWDLGWDAKTVFWFIQIVY